MAGLSGRRFALLAKVSHQAVAKALREGRLVAGADGIDPEHPVNGGYLALHGVRRAVEYQTSDLEARIIALDAKLRLTRLRLEEQRECYHNRANAVRRGAADADHFLAELRRLPAAQAPALADALEVAGEVAGAVLDELVELILADLGDLRAEAVRAAELA